MSSPFIGRNGNSVVIRISGPHSSACTQYGGAYRISTAKAEPATMKPEMNITKNAGPSAESTNEKSRPQCSQRWRSARKPWNSLPLPQLGQRHKSPATMGERALMAGGMHRACCTLPPHIDAGEQEQPDHVDEMPVPGGKLEAEMLGRGEVSEKSADQANDQERRADDHVRTVEAGRHEEGGAVDIAAEIEARVAVLVGLHAGEREAGRDGQDQAPFEPLTVVLQQRMVGPGYGGAGGEQNERIQERQMPWIEGLGSLRRPHAAEQLLARDLMHIGWE